MSFNILVITKSNPTKFAQLQLYHHLFFVLDYDQAVAYLATNKVEVILLEAEMFESRFKALVEANNVLLFLDPLLCLNLLKDGNDSLTGVSSKTHFYQQVDLLFTKSKQEELSLSIMIVDVDNFKQINDRLGHLAGDEFLQKLTQRIKANIREDDFLARFGGDEFIIALANTSLEQAKIVAQRLLSKLEISLGIASLEPSDLDLKMLINRADQALLKAKALGKNRAEIS